MANKKPKKSGNPYKGNTTTYYRASFGSTTSIRDASRPLVIDGVFRNGKKISKR
jgi:hypothetical protein